MKKRTLTTAFKRIALTGLMATTALGFSAGAHADDDYYSPSPQAQAYAANCEVYHADGRANLARARGLNQEQYAARANQIESQFNLCMQNSGSDYNAPPRQIIYTSPRPQMDAGTVFGAVVLGTVVGEALEGHHHHYDSYRSDYRDNYRSDHRFGGYRR